MKTLNLSNHYEVPQANVIELDIEGGIAAASAEFKPFEPGD